MTVFDEAQLCEAALAVADDLADALAVPPDVDYGEDYRPESPRWRDQSLSKGAAGVAILHGVRAQHGQRPASGLVHAWLARASRDQLSAGPGAGLWFGAPAVAFALHTSAPGRYPAAMARLDTAVAELTRARLATAAQRMDSGRRPGLYEFDLVRGLAGLGAYWLRRDPDGAMVRHTLRYLVRLTEPVRADDRAAPTAPGWWTNESPARETSPAFAAGHADFGAAHGIAGPLALLALALREGITVDGHYDAIAAICGWLDDWRQHSPAGPWWPERITVDELHQCRPQAPGPARPSWCYGTPGLARAQQLAALATGDTARQRAVEEAFAACLADPDQLARITDSGLCHGWAGLMITAAHAAADATTPGIAAQLPRLLNSLLAHAHDVGEELPGLIEGRAGVALTLNSIATGNHGPWPACLLIA